MQKMASDAPNESTPIPLFNLKKKKKEKEMIYLFIRLHGV